jgi:hypothetical protein
MTCSINKYTYLILAVICLIIAFFLENTLFNHHPEKNLIARFQKKLTEKEGVLEKRMAEIGKTSLNPGFSPPGKRGNGIPGLQKREIVVLVRWRYSLQGSSSPFSASRYSADSFSQWLLCG